MPAIQISYFLQLEKTLTCESCKFLKKLVFLGAFIYIINGGESKSVSLCESKVAQASALLSIH